MFRFQLEVAVVLAVSAFSSFVVLYSTEPREHKIELPVRIEDALDTQELQDPFDIGTPEDFIDGYPLDEQKFWNEVFWRKLAITIAVACIVVSSSISLGYVSANSERVNVATYAVHVSFSLYLLILSIRSFRQRSHAESILHITVLTTIAVTALLSTAIIPRTPPPAITSITEEPFIQTTFYTILALYIVVAIVVFTTRLGPQLYYPVENIYSENTVKAINNPDPENVCGIVGCSPWSYLLFSYTTKVVRFGNLVESLGVGDLPVLPGNMRATYNFSKMREATMKVQLRIKLWNPTPGSGWLLAYRLFRVNFKALMTEIGMAAVSAALFYVPTMFLKWLLDYFEVDPDRADKSWGWVYITGLLGSHVVSRVVRGQLWSLATTQVQVRLRIQLNSILFAKTLVRKNIAEGSGPKGRMEEGDAKKQSKNDNGDEFSTKSQVMTLMTSDVDRVGEFAWHLFSLIDPPIEIIIGSIFLYKLLGISCFFGLAVTCLFLPLNHYTGKTVIGTQKNLMKARDERVALMNEILGAIRMLKFMAWERNFEARVLKVREKELKYQKLNYTIETFWNAIWFVTPVLVTLLSFWHFTVVRQKDLTPSLAFTSILVFAEMRFALNALPETFINLLQTMVSLRRIEKYLYGAEVLPVLLPLVQQQRHVVLQSCTITWPHDQARGQESVAPSTVTTPHHKFMLVDLTCEFPTGELSLICGKLGTGKSLLLLALLGEADVLAGQLICPRSPPDAIASFIGKTIFKDNWIAEGLCAYVPQAAWLRNATVKENILFDLPYDEERYQRTLEACALLHDLETLEDGDESEVGERGINLSGGQKARVSLARAIYSRASVLLLDDVLSAVDAQTAHHLYYECLKGELTRGRTVILASHHVQLCTRGASYVVVVGNGQLQFAGSRDEFLNTDVVKTLVHSADNGDIQETDPAAKIMVEEKQAPQCSDRSESDSTIVPAARPNSQRKAPRKLVEDEKRAVGRIGKDIWVTYIWACGGTWFWALFIFTMMAASLSPVAENGWLRYWSNQSLESGSSDDAMFYVAVYAVITIAGLIISTARWFLLYSGSIHASSVLYKQLLESVLFTNIRFHDTVNRGRLLNRFGKDFEGIDSGLSDIFGRSIMYFLSALTTIVAVSVVGGPLFIFATIILAILYWNMAKIYGRTSRDLRRLDSVNRSPLYSIYGETISGAAVLRAFGASTKFLREMLRCVDMNINPYYWMWGANRWLSMRCNLLTVGILGAIAFMCLLSSSISASFAGFALTITNDLLFMVSRFVGLEQSMVAIEMVKEYSELPREGLEFVDPRPSPSWPSTGEIKCENLAIRYAPDLPNVLQHISFKVNPGEKVGILGRTGSGKSTLALSFLRFVEPVEGRILIDGIDISKVGLTDLRSRLTIIPQDPTILSGTLRSTLDVFSEYDDAEIFEALRRVHLIPDGNAPEDTPGTVNANVFRNLDSVVSEGGENFSTGEKQLLCMARAILKRSKVLVMDEATASVDYATDELIGKTIRQEFADSTLLTIAHRLRTVIDYDRVLILENGCIAEFGQPAVLLSVPSSKFYALCKATGNEEFLILKKRAGL